jgi:transposase
MLLDELLHKVNNMQTTLNIGKVTAVTILAESPDLEFFDNARQLAPYDVLTPKHRTSGTSVIRLLLSDLSFLLSVFLIFFLILLFPFS